MAVSTSSLCCVKQLRCLGIPLNTDPASLFCRSSWLLRWWWRWQAVGRELWSPTRYLQTLQNAQQCVELILWDQLLKAGMEWSKGQKRVRQVRGVEKASDSVLSQHICHFVGFLLKLLAEMTLLQMNEMLDDMLKQRFQWSGWITYGGPEVLNQMQKAQQECKSQTTNGSGQRQFSFSRMAMELTALLCVWLASTRLFY